MKKHRPRAPSPSEQMRLFWGLVAQPVVASAVAFVSFPGFFAGSLDAAVAMAAGVGIVAFFVTIICVLPTVTWLVARRYVTFARALALGVGFANLPVILGAFTAGVYGAAGALRAIAFASLIGLAGGAGFWVISIRRRDFSREPVAGVQR